MAQTDMHNLYLYLNGLARLQLSDQVLFLPKSLIDFSSEQIIYRVYVKFVQVKAVREAGTSLTMQSDHSKVFHMYSTSYSAIILGIYQNTIVCMHTCTWTL